MNEELKKDVVTIEDIQTKENQVTLKTDKGYFSFFTEKRDGTMSKAYETISEIKPAKGDTIVVSYKEKEHNGKIFKNAVIFFRARENDYKTTTAPATAKLAENQSKLVAKIQELEKRIEVLEGKNVSADDLESMFGGEVINPDTGGKIEF